MPDHDRGAEATAATWLNGRKAFCTQSPVATVVSTSAVLGEPGPGRRRAARQRAAVRARRPDRRDLGHPGHARHRPATTWCSTDVFLPADKIVGQRPYGELGRAAARRGRPLRTGGRGDLPRGRRAAPVPRGRAAAAGVAGRAVADRRGRGRSGEMEARLRVAWWALLGALDELGDDSGAPTRQLADGDDWPSGTRSSRRVAVVDLALEVAGGRRSSVASPLERAYRDVRGGPFHPLTPEATLTLLGERALFQSGIRNHSTR